MISDSGDDHGRKSQKGADFGSKGAKQCLVNMMYVESIKWRTRGVKSRAGRAPFIGKPQNTT